MNTYDVRIRVHYARPAGVQDWDDMTVTVEADDARQALALAVKQAPAADKDGNGQIDCTTHGLDMRQPPAVEE